MNQFHALREDEETLPYVLESVKRDLAHLNGQIKEIDKKISDHMGDHKELREDRELLTSIPGIGETTAATWIAHLGNLSRFDKPSQQAFSDRGPHWHCSQGESIGELRAGQAPNLSYRTQGVA